MDPADLALRRRTYALIASMGRVPRVEDLAEDVAMTPAEVVAAWRRLHDAHALVLDTDMATIRMANPFSAVPTPYRVLAAGRSWFGNCAWDALGICAALQSDGVITTVCADCGENLVVEVHDRRPQPEELLFHCLVPARHWWDDIVFT